MSVPTLNGSFGSPPTRHALRDLLNLIARLALTLTLVATGLPPATAGAQDASTPVAEPTEISAAPAEVPTVIVAPTETATATPPNTQPTAEPPEAPVPNSDGVAPVQQPIVAVPGQPVDLTLEYRITTPRLETGIHLELRRADNLVADSWVIDANGAGGFGEIDLIDSQTTPGTLAIHLRTITPSDARDGDTLTLFVDSVVRTLDRQYETGVAVDTAIATIVVEAPEPTLTAESTQPSPASPEPSDPTPTTESPVETPSPEATEPPATPASPQPEIPALPTAVATIDLASELTLIGRKSSVTIAIGESRTVALDYGYIVGFARDGTTISAQMVNWDGNPLSGWTVTLNGSPDTFHDSEHLDAGSAFDLEVTVSVDETVKENAKARLLFTVTVDPVAKTGIQEAFTFAAESIETAALIDDGSNVTEVVEGPMFRLDGGFTTAVVTAPDNGLTCFDPSASYPSAAADSMIPGQIAQFRCDLSLAALSVLPTFSGTATIQGANTAGWQIAATSQVTLLDLPIVAPTGAYSTSSVSFSGLGTLSLSALVGAGGFSFSIYFKAPSLPLSLAPVNSLSVVVNTTCGTALGSCNQLLGGTKTASATLTATVRDIQTTAYGGGGLTDLSLLGSVPDGLVMRLYCDTPATGTQVAPQEIVNVSCHIISLINLNLLGSVASVSADVAIAFTDSSPNWKLSYNSTPVTGTINVPLTTVLNAGVLSASADFTVTLQYDPGACVTTPFSGQPLNAINLTADYHLLLLSAVEIGLTDGWASVPIQLEGASSSPVGYIPLLSASGVSFGTYQFSGAAASYSKISGGQPVLSVTVSPNGGANCSARAFYVTAQFSSLAGYSDSGHTNPLGSSIAPGQIAFSGSPTGSYPSTTTFTPAVSASPVTVISSTNTLLSELSLTYPMALTPSASQSVGYYLGTVTLTVVSGTPP